MTEMNPGSQYGQTPIGIKNGMVVLVSDNLIAQLGLQEVKEQLGMTKRFPVVTDLGGNVVMVEGDSHEDAVHRYLNRTATRMQNKAKFASSAKHCRKSVTQSTR